jgi:hypothetical protein
MEPQQPQTGFVIRIATAILMILLAACAAAQEYPKYAATGSAYVPLDSWVYPAFDRLAALGYAPTAFAGMRPWTRAECARILLEANDLLGSDASSAEGQRLYTALHQEFREESDSMGDAAPKADVESVYLRATSISGTPLRDGYHFSQTLVDDYGRPYGEGGNAVTGFSARASAGPLVVYTRGEYQHAPEMPALSDAVRQVIATMDRTPIQPAAATPEVNQFRLLDTYVALNIKNNQISFGKQSLWWGPSRGTAMMFSDNAEPFYSVRFTRVMPTKLPWIFGKLGPMRFDSFLGQLSGHKLIAPDLRNVVPVTSQPYIDGQKISFKPTPNLEFGVSRTVVFGGPGYGLTFRTLYRSLFSTANSSSGLDPGDRRSGFDFSYRVPGLRKWLVIYSDSMTEDEPSPIAYPRRSAWAPGLYMPQIPKLPKLDFRFESAYTDLPELTVSSYYYWNLHYRDGFTNRGQLLASWVGRQGRGLQASSTYWFTPQTTVQFGWRNHWVSQEMAGGGNVNDYLVNAQVMLRPHVALQSLLQYEKWQFPVIDPAAQSNFTASFQVTFWPTLRSK